VRTRLPSLPVYVSPKGDDANDGLTPATAVRTIPAAYSAARMAIANKFRQDGILIWGWPTVRGWQRRAADHLGVTPNTISNWVSGKRPIRESVLLLVEQTLSTADKQGVDTRLGK
jgi:hypothetical protein